MNPDAVVLIIVLAACSLSAAWPARWLALRCSAPGAAGLAGFFAAYALAVAAAFATGLILDLVRHPYRPTPPPGNFTIPLPWALVAPGAQALTGGPLIGVIIAVAAAIAVGKRTSN